LAGLAGDKGEMYIGVGSNTNAGHPSGIMGSGTQKENYFSGAVLVANMGCPAFNGAITYDAQDDGNPVGGFGKLTALGCTHNRGGLPHISWFAFA
jgi:hypothetical protein